MSTRRNAKPWEDGGPVLLDGGLGALFIVQGLEVGRAPEEWVLDHPDRVEAAHRTYVEAGSDIIHAVTFGANAIKARAAGLHGREREINLRAVALARRACHGHDQVQVAGDLGPTGQLFPPMGQATEAELEEAFRGQVETLCEAGVDLFSLETMYDLREALCAVRAAAASGLPVMASMTVAKKPRGFFSMVGDAVGPSLKALGEAGASVVGFNCSLTSDAMRGLMVEARAAVDLPLVAQPNAGQPRATPEGIVYDADPVAFARDLLGMVQDGVQVVGGCCGTDGRFIREARRLLDEARSG